MSAWSREHFDAILMDIRMPVGNIDTPPSLFARDRTSFIRIQVMDGTEATRAIRSLEEQRAVHAGDRARVPIVALSASVDAESVRMFMEAGLTDFLAKPVAKAQLSSCLNKWIHGCTAALTAGATSSDADPIAISY